jgi:hypothetical protein
MFKALVEEALDQDGQWCIKTNELLWPLYVPYDNETSVPVQDDGNSCGVLCISYVEEKLGRKMFFTPINQSNLKNLSNGRLRLRLWTELASYEQ